MSVGKFEWDRSIYLEHRKALTELEADQIKTLDRSILALSGGAFGLSIVFIKDVVGTGPAESIFFLQVAWWLLGLAIFCNVLSYFFAAQDMRREVAKIDRCYSEQVPYSRNKNPFYKVTGSLNVLALACFLAGIGLFAAFANANIARVTFTPERSQGIPFAPTSLAPAGEPSGLPKEGDGSGKIP